MSDFLEGELIYHAKELSPGFTEFFLVPISDLHFGDPLFSLKHFLRTRDFVLTKPNIFVVLNGDLANVVIKSSLGDLYNQIKKPQDQRDWLIKELKPIAHRVLGMTTGNHEARIDNAVGIDISADIANALKVSYRPTGIALKISYGDGNNRMKGKPFVSWVYLTHGYGGARTKSAKAVKAERAGHFVNADSIIMSHDHVVDAAPDVILDFDPRTHLDEKGFKVGKVIARRKMLVKSNAYLKWGGYSEMGGFPPTDLTTPVMWFLTPQSPLWSMFPDKPQQSIRTVV